MIGEATLHWAEANQRFLMSAIAGVRERLERLRSPADAFSATAREMAGRPAGPAEPTLPDGETMDAGAAEAWPHGVPPTLETLCSVFGLSSFERDILLLCAAVELDGACAELCRAGGSGPTFGLALAAFPHGHWSALAPDRPLRHWRLIEIGGGAGVTGATLRIDERILHFLVGLDTVDEQLTGFVRPVAAAGAVLAPSQRRIVDAVAVLWERAGPPPPIVHLRGAEGTRDIAVAVAEILGMSTYVMPAHVIPTTAHELELLVRIWARESALDDRALLIETDDRETAKDAAREASLRHFLESVHGPVFVTGPERRTLPHRSIVTFDVARPRPDEQRAIWSEALGPDGARLNGAVDRLVAHFDLGPRAIRAVCSRAAAEPGAEPLDRRLWRACREYGRPRLGNLAQPIEPVATWDDIVLPEPQRAILRDVAVHFRQRTTVYESWGFSAKSRRGLGISALFAGPSGTGKTMAAEVLANELDLDLYRIDLSGVVSKYIGETEKNLARVFDAAEEAGAILLFDEADALFGKRTEVKDSHDRYANIEVSYLLQRMEAYRGLAILTTNLKGSIDDAFLRRIRFLVNFPFPDARQREEIWRRAFPRATPTEGLDYARLARLNVAGGNIRNIAMNAAVLAAEQRTPVTMAHLLRAARAEYAKLERPLTDAEIRGWA